MRISDWSSDVCSSDLPHHLAVAGGAAPGGRVDPHHGLRGGVLEHLRSQPHRGQPRDPAAGLPRRARLAETAHRAALHPRPEAAALASRNRQARGFAGFWRPNAWLAGAFVLEKAFLYDPRALPGKRETPAGELRDMNRAGATSRGGGNRSEEHTS